MKQVTYSEPTNIWRHRTQFIRHGDLALGILTPLSHTLMYWCTKQLCLKICLKVSVELCNVVGGHPAYVSDWFLVRGLRQAILSKGFFFFFRIPPIPSSVSGILSPTMSGPFTSRSDSFVIYLSLYRSTPYNLSGWQLCKNINKCNKCTSLIRGWTVQSGKNGMLIIINV